MKKYAFTTMVIFILLGSMSSFLVLNVDAILDITIGVKLADGKSYNFDNYGKVFLYNSTWGNTSSIMNGNATFSMEPGDYEYNIYSAGAMVGNGSLQITFDKNYYEVTADSDFSFLHRLSKFYVLNSQGSNPYVGAYVKLYRWVSQADSYVLIGVDPNKTGNENTYIKTDDYGIANYSYQLRPSGYYKIEVYNSPAATSPIYTTNASLMDPALGDIFLIHPKNIGIALNHSIPMNPIKISTQWAMNNSIVFSDTMFAKQENSVVYEVNLTSSSGEIALKGAVDSNFDLYLLDQKGGVLAKSESITYPDTISFQFNSLSNPYYIEVKNSKNITAHLEDNIFQLDITGKPDFNLEVSYASILPWDQSLWHSGQSISYNIQVTSFSGFNDSVSFSLSGLPNDFSYSFYPESLIPNATSTLTIAAPSIASDETYLLTINGTGGGKTHSAYANLTVNFWIFSYYLPTQTQKINSTTTRVVYGYFANFTWQGNAINSFYTPWLAGWPLYIDRIQYGAGINVTVTLPIDVTIVSNSTYVRPGANVEFNATVTTPTNQAQIKVGAYIYCEIIDSRSNTTWIVPFTNIYAYWRYANYPLSYNFTTPLGTFYKQFPIPIPLFDIGIVKLIAQLTPWVEIVGNVSSLTEANLARIISPSSGILTWNNNGETQEAIVQVFDDVGEDEELIVQLSQLTYSVTATVGLDFSLDLNALLLFNFQLFSWELLSYHFPFATLVATIPMEFTAAEIDALPPNVSSVNLSNQHPDPSDTVTISSTVSDATSGVKNVSLHYSTNGGNSWTSVSMFSHSPKFTANIPPQAGGSIVQYYVTAEDIVGNIYQSDISQYGVKSYTTISPRTFSLIQKRTSTLTSTLRDERGNPISGATMVFYYYMNDVWKIIGSVVTDANGDASTLYTPITAGESKIKISYSGSSMYVESSSVSSVSIIPVYDLTINVKDLFGLRISGVTIRLLENAKLVESGVTGAEGSLTFRDIPEGSYQIEAAFFGQSVIRSISLNKSTTQSIAIALSLFVIGAIVAPLSVIITVAFWVTKKRRKSTVKE